MVYFFFKLKIFSVFLRNLYNSQQMVFFFLFYKD